MWAGDTAQTISVESVFTFEQLGALIYRYYVRGLLLPNCVDVASTNLTIFLAINSDIQAAPWPARNASIARESSVTWWHCQLCKCHLRSTAEISWRYRCLAARGGGYRERVARILSQRTAPM
jgi:hypothetical protein